jgi:hypothetical protein
MKKKSAKQNGIQATNENGSEEEKIKRQVFFSLYRDTEVPPHLNNITSTT